MIRIYEKGGLTMDRYTVRRVVNDLIDRMIDEGISREEIVELLDLDDSEKEYFDVKWLDEKI